MVETLAEGQPFKEAADFFAQKVNLPTDAWTDLKEGQHARGFVVAGAKKDALLADFRQALQRAFDEGRTLADFRKDFDRIVAKHGWSYRGSRGWRSRVIYDTNLRTAHAAGRWQQVQRLKDRFPYLEYDAVRDSRTRPLHADWDGTILSAGDAWWDTHHPPNGWNCRCTVRMRSERQLRRQGKSVSSRPAVQTEDRVVRTPSGTANWRTPRGIDTGFGYNVGKAAFGQRLDEATMAAWRQQGSQAWERLTPGGWQAAGRPGTLSRGSPQTPAPSASPSDRAAYTREILGGEETVAEMPDGSRVHLSADALAQHTPEERVSDLRFVADTLTSPSEVWLNFERHKGTGRVELRKRAVKAFRLDDGASRVVTAQTVGGRFEALTAEPGDGDADAPASRVGRLLYSRDGGDG